MRTRGDGLTINQYLEQIRAKYPDIVIMADISTYEEGVNAWKCGVDLVSTTMSGYTPYSPKTDGPDSVSYTHIGLHRQVFLMFPKRETLI